tara:strand:+ start:316 stop:540 length:225 start_codon:yes stop_codon:yes gene_type:complete
MKHLDTEVQEGEMSRTEHRDGFFIRAPRIVYLLSAAVSGVIGLYGSFLEPDDIAKIAAGAFGTLVFGATYFRER